MAVEHGAAQGTPSLLFRAAGELSARDLEVAATVSEAFDTIRAGYTDCIVDAQAAGEADADAEALGTYFCAVVEGMGDQARRDLTSGAPAGGDREPRGPVDRSARRRAPRHRGRPLGLSAVTHRDDAAPT